MKVCELTLDALEATLGVNCGILMLVGARRWCLGGSSWRSGDLDLNTVVVVEPCAALRTEIILHFMTGDNVYLESENQLLLESESASIWKIAMCCFRALTAFAW